MQIDGHSQMGSFIGAITFFSSTKGSQSYSCWSTKHGLVSTKIDVWLNGQALFDPVFKWYLNDLKINLPNKSYSLDNRLINEKSSHFIESLAPRCRLIFSQILFRISVSAVKCARDVFSGLFLVVGGCFQSILHPGGLFFDQQAVFSCLF